MEPDLDKLHAEFRAANEDMSQAFIRQTMAWNNLSRALAELREKQPTLFNH